MAGRPGYAKQIVELEKKLDAAQFERDRYKKILISIDPSYIDMDKPPPLEEYDADIVIPRIMAMADMGMGEDQWVGEFGLSRREWSKWKAQHPELVDAVDRGLQAALAWWQESARKANETNSKFGISAYKMRIATLKAMKPDSLEDIIALISLYRPGPMENIPTYVERKQGDAAPDYLHPSLEPVLKETYGVIIYQEQVMQIAQILSGYSLGEADLLRRAMGKKKKEEMDKQRIRFVDGAKKNDVAPEKASSIFDLVQKFAGYGFNKSHAAAYAYIAYQTAYLKANHPAALLAASMSLDKTNTDKLAVFVKEARRSEVEVSPPHVNRSFVDFEVEDGEILYGLSAIKNVGEGAMAEIVAARQEGGVFKDLYDLAERAPLKAVGKRSLENLIKAGALDGLSKTRAEALANVDLLVRYSAQRAEEKSSAQHGLFDVLSGGGGSEDSGGLARPKLSGWSPTTRLEELNEESAALGFYFSGHPLDDYAVELKRLGAVNYAEAFAAAASGRVEADVAVVVRGVRMRRSKAGNPFAWVECSDATGDFEVTVFSETLSRCRDMLEPGALLLMRLAGEDRDGEIRFGCEGARALDAAAAQTTSQLRVSVSGPNALEAVKRRIAAVKPPSPQEAGDVVISLQLSGALAITDMVVGEKRGGAHGGGAQTMENGLFTRQVELKLKQRALCTPSTRSALKSIDGVLEVELV